MLELGVGADILRGVGWVLWGVLAFALYLAATKPATKLGKSIGVITILCIFFGPMIPGAIRAHEFKQRYTKAKAVFDERCKNAGEKIYKTVDNVDGILLLNIREPREVKDTYDPSQDPMLPDAALPRQAWGDDYIREFLKWEHRSKSEPRGQLRFDPRNAIANGYRFVDVKQANGSAIRYRLDQSERIDDNKLAAMPTKGQHARYAVGFANDINSEDRKHWVASTVIKVIDTQTGDVLAERVSYSFEPGLGSTAGFRRPWPQAITCPDMQTDHPTRLFVDQIVKPNQTR